MHLDTPESISSGKSAPRVLAKISFDRPAANIGGHTDEGDGLSMSPFSGARTYDRDSSPVAVTEGIDPDAHAADCSSEYFLG